MGSINYRLWANVMRFFMFFGICAILLGFVLSIIGEFTKIDFSISRLDYGYRNYQNGYPVKTNMYLNIPDTVMLRQEGTLKYGDRDGQYAWTEKGLPKDTLINQFKTYHNYKAGDRIGNFVLVPDEVLILVKTTDNFRRWFYIFYDHLPRLFVALICLLLFKLINTYLKGNFLNPKSFYLIRQIGNSFILMNVVSFIFLQVKLYFLPKFDLNTISKTSGFNINHLQLSIDIRNKFDPTYLCIGLMILILADIIKNAIVLKKEQDLTI